jgi:membrane-bound serine protease (ClpP class)
MVNRLIWIVITFSLLLGSVFPASLALAQTAPAEAAIITLEGPISAAYAEYLERGLQAAARRQAEVVILQLNTPGGSLDIMNRMVTAIRSSSVPVVVYVSPANAMAGSAGTIITLAAHAAAMAPETTIGAASPISSEGTDLDETSETKAKNMMKAIVRNYAAHRGPEAVRLAEQTIDNAIAVTAQEAITVGLIDFIASDLNSLLTQLDGFTVKTDEGVYRLHTGQAAPVPINPTLVEQILIILTNPNILFLLLAIGVQAILIEISSPGGWVAGFIGVICVGLAVYGMGFLSVNWFGLLFLGVAFALFILEIKAPSHGALTAAGVGTLIMGSLMLFNSPQAPDFQRVSVPLVISISAITGGLFFIVFTFALKAQHLPPAMGAETIVGRTGIVNVPLTPQGIVSIGGEQWTAELEEGEVESLPRGARVEVTRLAGLKLMVRKLDNKPKN